MPVRTAPANLSADDAQLRAEYVREVLALLYPGAGRRLPRHRVRPGARRAPAAPPGAGRRSPGRGGRRRALCRAAVAARAVEARRRRGRAAHRRGVRAAARPRHGAGWSRHDRDLSPRRAGHRRPAECPHRTGAGQPQAGAAGAHPGRRDARVREAGRQRADPAAGEGRGGGAGDAERCRDCAASPSRRLLHSGQWRGHEVLVQAALPVWEPRVPADPAPLRRGDARGRHRVRHQLRHAGRQRLLDAAAAPAGRGRRASGRVPARPRRGPAGHRRPATCG